MNPQTQYCHQDYPVQKYLKLLGTATSLESTTWDGSSRLKAAPRIVRVLD